MRTARGCAIGMALVLFGCAAAPTQPPTTSNSGANPAGWPAVSQLGCSAQFPPDWKPAHTDDDFAFAAVPASARGIDDDPTLEIQVPKLSAHIPGLIPLGLVASGYLDDLKKRYPDPKVDERSTARLDGCEARRFVTSFQNHGKPWRELALLTVHGDHVYVITGNCDAAVFDKARPAFEALAGSVKWTDKP